MSDAAQTVSGRSTARWAPHRTAAVLRHLGLRGAAIVYLGAMVAVPVAAIVTNGIGDGIT